jgi:hypothetical protein
MLEFLRLVMFDLFMAFVVGEHCVVCCYCMDFLGWMSIKS